MSPLNKDQLSHKAMLLGSEMRRLGAALDGPDDDSYAAHVAQRVSTMLRLLGKKLPADHQEQVIEEMRKTICASHADKAVKDELLAQLASRSIA